MKKDLEIISKIVKAIKSYVKEGEYSFALEEADTLGKFIKNINAFDKNNIKSVDNMEGLKIGQRGYFGDSIEHLSEDVRCEDEYSLSILNNIDKKSEFPFEHCHNEYHYKFFYPIEEK